MPNTKIKVRLGYQRYYPKVFWIQGSTCFLLWIAGGVLMTWRSEAIRAHAIRLSRPVRVSLAAALMLGGAFLPLLALKFASSTGTAKAMSPAGWVAIALGGLVFCVATALATSYLVTLAQESARQSRVTEPVPVASTLSTESSENL